MTHAISNFILDKRQKEAFNQLKEIVSMLRYCVFDNSLRTRVIADASPVALGAVLVQFNGPTDIEPRPIAHLPIAMQVKD